MMYELFFENIAKHIQLEPDEVQLVEGRLRQQSLVKNERLLGEGEQCKDICFVVAGCLRIFQGQQDGSEVNILFCPEAWWAADILSFSNGTPATYAIEALEPSEVVCISAADLEALYLQVPKLERFFRILFQNGFGLYQRRLTLALSTSATVRYALFTKQYPTLVNRVSQKHIASYLGVTQVFLSILRKRQVS